MDNTQQTRQPVVQVRVYLAGRLVEELELPGPLAVRPAKGTRKGSKDGR